MAPELLCAAGWKVFCLPWKPEWHIAIGSVFPQQCLTFSLYFDNATFKAMKVQPLGHIMRPAYYLLQAKRLEGQCGWHILPGRSVT